MGERLEGPDAFPLPEGSPYAAEHRLLSRLLAEEAMPGSAIDLPLDDLPPAALLALLRAALSRLAHVEADVVAAWRRAERHEDEASQARWRNSSLRQDRLQILVAALLRRKPPLAAADLEALLDWMLGEEGQRILSPPDLRGIVDAVRRLAKEGPLPEAVTGRLVTFRQYLRRQTQGAARKLAEPIEELIGAEPRVDIAPGEVWADRALTDLAAFESHRRAAWTALLAHAQGAVSAKPTARWL